MFRFIVELIVDEQRKYITFETESRISEETAILLAGIKLGQTSLYTEGDGVHVEFVELESM